MPADCCGSRWRVVILLMANIYLRALTLCLTMAALLLLQGCYSTPVSRIGDNLEIFASLPLEHQSLVRQGLISEGMSMDAVYLAWGSPDQFAESLEKGVKDVSWLYIGYRTEVVPGYTWAPYRGRYCDSYYGYPRYSPNYISVPYLYRKVTFRDGRVVAYQAPVRGR